MMAAILALLIGGLVSLLFPKQVLEMFAAFEKRLPFGRGFFTEDGEILYRICGGTMVMIALIALAAHFFL